MKEKSVVLQGNYNLDGEYIPFEDNPLHGKTFNDVTVEISQETRTVYDFSYPVDVVRIEGCEPIECELVSCRKTEDGTMVISICQDWG